MIDVETASVILSIVGLITRKFDKTEDTSPMSNLVSMINLIVRLALSSFLLTVLVTVPSNGISKTLKDLGFPCSQSRFLSKVISEKPSNADNKDTLQGILGGNTQVEKIAGNFQFIEGPVWHPKGFLLFSDIAANTIYQWTPDKKTKVFRRPSQKANGNTLDREGRLVTAESSTRRVSRTNKNGKIVTLARLYQGKRFNSPNDLVVKSDGSIYFTDPPYGIEPEQEELGFYGVYRLAPNGKLTVLAKDILRPNGIVFSPDEKRLYVNDSEQGYIRVFDVKADGTLENGRLFAELKDPNQKGVPDGMKVDRQGNVYSTGPGGVWIFSPSGNLLGKIEVPEVATNLAWGDEDYKTLYITATNSLYRIRIKIAGVRAGKI